MEKDGFTKISAIFYAVFHPTKGTKVLNQVPERSIGSSNENFGYLFNLDTVKNFIIPKPQLCNKLISIKIGKYKVLGYPVNIKNEMYARNSFSFNFCFVFPYEGDSSPYEYAVRRMGTMFQALEEQSFILSKLDKMGYFFKDAQTLPMISSDPNNFYAPGFKRTRKVSLSSIESLIQQIYQDLNNYSECCIPLDSANSVDIKLFPIMPPPTSIEAPQVPLLTVKLDSLIDANWDPTMVKIVPYIDGLNSISKISELANVSYILTKQCIQHLMHYKCIIIIDIFQFSNIYAPTDRIGNFLKLNGIAEDCQAYVTCSDTASMSILPLNPDIPTPRGSYPNSISPVNRSSSMEKAKRTGIETVRVPSKTTLFYLYRSLSQGQTLKDWYIQHKKHLANIDIRRFINFGVVRGLIYRVKSYPILSEIVNAIENDFHTDVNELHQYLRANMEAKRASRANNYTQSNREKLSGSADGNESARTRKVSFNERIQERTFSSMASCSSDRNIYPSEDSNPQSLGTEGSSTDNTRNHTETSDDIYRLVKLLKGFQDYDSICTEMKMSRKDVSSLISDLGHIDTINR